MARKSVSLDLRLCFLYVCEIKKQTRMWFYGFQYMCMVFDVWSVFDAITIRSSLCGFMWDSISIWWTLECVLCAWFARLHGVTTIYAISYFQETIITCLLLWIKIKYTNGWAMKWCAVLHLRCNTQIHIFIIIIIILYNIYTMSNITKIPSHD